MIASFGMALRYSFDMGAEADQIDKAIAGALEKGFRTSDIASAGMKTVGTKEMGDAILAELEAQKYRACPGRGAYSWSPRSPGKVSVPGSRYERFWMMMRVRLRPSSSRLT